MDMLCLFETIRNVAADTLGWRQRVGHIGVCLFKFFQLFQEHIEIPVGDFGRVKHVIVVVMPVYFVAQGEDALPVGCHLRGQSFIFKWLRARSTLQRVALQ